MVENLGYYIFIGIFGVILHLIALYVMRNRLKHNAYFIVILFSMMSSWVILVFTPYYEGINQLELVKILMDFALLSVAIVFINAYLYYESLLNNRAPLWRFTFFICVFLFVVGLIILDLFNVYNAPNLFFITYFSGTIASFFVLYVLQKTFKLNKHKAIKIDIIAVILMLIGTIIYEYHGLLVSNGIIIRFTIESSSIYTFGAIFFLGAIFVLAYNSYLYGDYIHFLPVEIHTILIYNKAGLLAYNKTFGIQKEGILKQPEMLISGALMAFTGFFKEILGTKEKLTHIQTTGFEFLFSELPNGEGTLVILLSKANYFIAKSFKKFSNSIPKDILNIINKPGMLGYYQIQIDKILKENFPYLEILKKNKIIE